MCATGEVVAHQPVESYLTNNGSDTVVRGRATTTWPENHRGSSNTVRQDGNLENAGGDNKNFPSQLIPDILFSFHNFACATVH